MSTEPSTYLTLRQLAARAGLSYRQAWDAVGRKAIAPAVIVGGRFPGYREEQVEELRLEHLRRHGR